MATRDGALHRVPDYALAGIVDRIGAGDAFAAGVLHGLLTGMGDAAALHFGLAAACLKHSIKGDFNLVDVDDVTALVNGDGLDRALKCLGAGVAKECRVGERMSDQALGQALLRLDVVEIGAVPELPALRLQRRHQVRMGVAEQGDRDAAAEVEIAASGAIEQVGALAALEAYLGPFIDRQQRRHCSV